MPVVTQASGVSGAELRESLAKGREAEAAPMARWPSVARRDGDVLTIAVGGRSVASFKDGGECDGFDQCSRWRFQGVWSLGGKTYPWLTFFNGEGEETAYLVDGPGRLVGAQGLPSASPDGRWLVVAFNDPDTEGGLTIFEAGPTGLVMVADAPARLGCQAGEWHDAARLALTCMDAKSLRQRWLKANLVLRDGAWSVRPIAELDPVTKAPLARPFEPLVEIPTLTNVQEGDGDYAYESGKGYRRLVADPG
jgi:hypothetical protein